MNIFCNNKIGYQGFEYKWIVQYPNVLPINHQFKFVFKHRWFRIHNFDGDQRYPRNKQDIAQLLHRQNTVMQELLGDQDCYSLIFDYDETPIYPHQRYQDVLDVSNYKPIHEVPLHLVQPDEYDEEMYLCWAYKETQFKVGEFNRLLIEIAKDQGGYECIFASFANDCLICPYDGGIDIVVRDAKTKEYYQEKFKDWVFIPPQEWLSSK